MRLGHLLDEKTKHDLRAMVATTEVPWYERPEVERMTIVASYCDTHADRLGQFLDKKCRSLCLGVLPGKRVLLEWIRSHASALSQQYNRWSPDKCMKESMFGVLNFYGYAKPYDSMKVTFDKFELREKNRPSQPSTH